VSTEDTCSNTGRWHIMQVRLQQCLLVLACAFDCPLATSGAATSSLSRRMLVSDNSLSLKMTYALNLSSSHSIPAHRQGILLRCGFMHCSFQYVCTQAGHLFYCKFIHCSLQYACTQAGHLFILSFYTVFMTVWHQLLSCIEYCSHCGHARGTDLL